MFASFLLGFAADASGVTCPIKNIASPVVTLAARTGNLPIERQVAAVRAAIIEPNSSIYQPDVLSSFTAPQMDAAIVRTLAAARKDEKWTFAIAHLEKRLPTAELQFHKLFPDFRCDFTIYLIDSLGTMDGAGREIDHRPALVFGIDQIAEEGDVLPLPILISHELFHRYHHQVSGFSDDPGENQAIWRALWVEGLATYVSSKVSAGSSLEQALGPPTDMIATATPHLAAMARDLLVHFDEVNAKTFNTYFSMGSAARAPNGYPWRSGYYVGYLVAQDLGRRRSLHQLALMHGPLLEAEIRKALQRLAAND